MALVTLKDAKNYLRVDTVDDDELIGVLLESSEKLCVDVARLSDEQWKEIMGEDIDQQIYSEEKSKHIKELLRVAILYAVAYLYEHREDADHHELILTLRSLLFYIREGVW